VLTFRCPSILSHITPVGVGISD
jgi:hypothetical protein